MRKPDLINRLRERAVAARAEGTATAISDARHFEEAADVAEREVAAQAALARIRKVRDGYADQAKFADVDQASHFREFVRRIDDAVSK
jgi:hypothetical protein